MLKVCLATVFACGVVLLGAIGCSSGTESHDDHSPTSTPVPSTAPTSSVAQSSEAPAPAVVPAPAPVEPQAPAAAPEPQATTETQAPPAVQAPQPEPAKPAPTLTAPGFEPRAGY